MRSRCEQFGIGTNLSMMLLYVIYKTKGSYPRENTSHLHYKERRINLNSSIIDVYPETIQLIQNETCGPGQRSRYGTREDASKH